MNVVIRVDASTRMGTGHVMRCLAIATRLRESGSSVTFISRRVKGDLIDYIRCREFEIKELPLADAEINDSECYTETLAGSVQLDAGQSVQAMGQKPVDWLIVDHYGIDRTWQVRVRPFVRRIMVVDDLANRSHDCELLLDQSADGERALAYRRLIGEQPTLLIGPNYALMHESFATMRPYSLKRRRTENARRVLVFFGGGDIRNELLNALRGLKLCARPWRHTDVVVGAAYPALEELQNEVIGLPNATIHVQTERMAQLLAEADFAVTGGGSVAWERCALGVAGIVAILADNQNGNAEWLRSTDAALVLGSSRELTPHTYAVALDSTSEKAISEMSRNAARICDGSGASRVVSVLEQRV